MSDGSHTISEIAKKTKIDAGNLSRAVSNWVEHGIAFWIGEKNNARLLHVYSLPKEAKRKKRL